MARSCQHNRDCPQGKQCVSGTCADSSATTTPAPQQQSPIPTNRQCTYDTDCGSWGSGARCVQGACTTPISGNDVTGAYASANTWLAQQPGAPGGPGGGTPAAAEDCQTVCMPNDPYAPFVGNQPLGQEGNVPMYATPWQQEGVGAGSHNPADMAYLNNYAAQEQAFNTDWTNYSNAIRSGGALPAAGITPADQQAQVAASGSYPVQQGNQAPFTQYLANRNYGY